MKVAFVAPNLEVGGAERQWSILVPGLRDREIDVGVFTLDGTGPFFDELVEHGIDASLVSIRSGRLPIRGPFQAASVIASGAPDAVITAGVSAHVIGHLAGRRAKAAHVAAMHATAEFPVTRRQKLLLRGVAPRARAATAVTTAQVAFLRSLGFRPDGIRVIPTGLEAPTIAHRPEEVRASLGVRDDEFLALLVATLRPEKRVDRFVDTVSLANGANPRIRGFVAGAGPELERIRARCKRTGGVVTALGLRRDVGDLVNAADVVCLTSETEALPISLLEAMALGRPVVATDVGGVRDAVVEGQTGLLVDQHDVQGFAAALQELAANDGVARRLGRAGRRRHEELFTVDRMVAAHVELFDEVVSDRGRARSTTGATVSEQ